MLSHRDPPPLLLKNEDAPGPFPLVCDHAGRHVPEALELGVAPADMERHIAWDIGALALAEALSDALHSPLVAQPYSRLVIDCNREPARADACPEVSDGTLIPGNVGLTAASKAARVAAIHEPYHARIAALLDARAGRTKALVLVHSFTPSMGGVARPWRFGVLHTGGALALEVLRRLREREAGPVGDNEPYAMDAVDYTAYRHGRDRGLPFVELEVRQDLIATAEGRAPIAALLADVLPAALASVQ